MDFLEAAALDLVDSGNGLHRGVGRTEGKWPAVVSWGRPRRMVVGGVLAGDNTAAGRRGCGSEVDEDNFRRAAAGDDI